MCASGFAAHRRCTVGRAGGETAGLVTGSAVGGHRPRGGPSGRSRLAIGLDLRVHLTLYRVEPGLADAVGDPRRP